MSTIHSYIRRDTHLFIRLPSDSLKLVELKSNTIVEVGKLGSFPSNLLLGRPYYSTYELLDKRDGEEYSRLRIVPASELNAETGTEDVTPSESRGETATPNSNGVPDAFDLLGEDGTVIIKNNRLTIDDASRQALSQHEIEELKRSMGGKEIVEKILANHAGLDEKTVFSRAKYTLRKSKKYLRRFTALPMDIGRLIEYVMVKEAPRILELREESLGLMTAWSNVHFSDSDTHSGRRLLVLDDTGGLVVAAMAEKMGILYLDADNSKSLPIDYNDETKTPLDEVTETDGQSGEQGSEKAGQATKADSGDPVSKFSKLSSHSDFPIPAPSNTITVLHPAVQPNLSLLKYFGYDTNQPDLSHPLHKHLKSLSWLQLLHPNDDTTYCEPEMPSDHTLRSWKSGKRTTYWKKRRRWDRCKSIVDEARAGGFDSVVVCSRMNPSSILPHTLPLVRGGGHVVIYSPTSEPLVEVMDLYSRERRSAYINALSKGQTPDEEDFPVDPRLLLAPTLQTSRVWEWQVLPGRTHPLMTGRGGAEGYVFTARRAVPLEGGVEAKGNFSGKRRKVEQSHSITTS